MGLDLKKESFLKKNQRFTKYITIALVGVLILVVIYPANSHEFVNGEKELNEQTSSNYSSSKEDERAKYYEEKLKHILEKTYGKNSIDVMVNLSSKITNEGFYSKDESEYVVDGVLIIANVDDESAIVDITYCVSALFGLSTHKVAVMIKK